MDAAWIEIGRVRSVMAARREARLSPLKGKAHEFADRTWFQVRSGGNVLRLKVEKVQSIGDEFRVVFSPGVPRDIVGNLRGAVILVPEDELRGLSPTREWRLADLVGLRVVDAGGTLLGEVCEVYETAADGAFGVAKTGGGKMLLPAIPQVVLDIDLAEETLTVGDIAPYVVDDAD
jgi:16S rRNA processing protein RimM